MPTATLALLPFYFLVSVLVERAVLLRSLIGHDRRRVSKATWLANGASYGLLLAATAGWPGSSQVPPYGSRATALSNNPLTASIASALVPIALAETARPLASAR